MPEMRLHNYLTKRRETLVPIVAAIMRRHATASWREILTKANVPHAEVRDYAEVFDDPQVAARNMKVTVRDPAGKEIDLLGSPFHMAGSTLPGARLPPVQGQDTASVLSELLQLDANRLESLRRSGVI